MKVRVRALLPLLLVCTASADPTSNTNELLEDIRDALTEDYTTDASKSEDNYDYGWGQANLLSATSNVANASSGSLAEYWSGASAFGTEGMNSIQKTQTFLDVLLAKPYDPTLAEPKKVDYETKAKLINGGANDDDINNIEKNAKSFFESGTANKKIAEIYFELYKTYILARNCTAY